MKYKSKNKNYSYIVEKIMSDIRPIIKKTLTESYGCSIDEKDVIKAINASQAKYDIVLSKSFIKYVIMEIEANANDSYYEDEDGVEIECENGIEYLRTNFSENITRAINAWVLEIHGGWQKFFNKYENYGETNEKKSVSKKYAHINERAEDVANDKFGYDIYTCDPFDGGYDIIDCIEDSSIQDGIEFDNVEDAYNEGLKHLKKYLKGDYLMEIYRITDYGLEYSDYPNVYNHDGKIVRVN